MEQTFDDRQLRESLREPGRPAVCEDPRLAAVRLVVIGTSAGGVEALGILLAALPARCRAAVAVVLHIPPDRASLLPKLYAERCALAIKEVEDKETIAEGTVYFAAPDYHMQIEPERTFSLSLEEPVNFSRPAIDLTFESAAYAYRSQLLAIILTGASADGAAGLRTARHEGALAWVQDPALASSAMMPAAAIRIAGADHILSIAQIAAGLACLPVFSAP
jgi:two-component system, chemotaxis family, protein-glutamate methylesterase/glutaminase